MDRVDKWKSSSKFGIERADYTIENRFDQTDEEEDAYDHIEKWYQLSKSSKKN